LAHVSSSIEVQCCFHYPSKQARNEVTHMSQVTSRLNAGKYAFYHSALNIRCRYKLTDYRSTQLWKAVSKCALYGLAHSSRVKLFGASLSAAPQRRLELFLHTIVISAPCGCVGRDSAVGIATRYGLDGPGIEYRWRRDFPHPTRPAVGPTQPPIPCVPGHFRE
jgi:hypothetical protein